MNRRAPRDFAAIPKGMVMDASLRGINLRGASSQGADMPTTKSQPRTASRAPSSWGLGKGRDRSPLKHLGALRGAGMLTWSGGGAGLAAEYELDVYERGAVRTVTGSLEGDFSTLLGEDGEALALTSLRLRLEDGRQLTVELTDIDPSTAGFDAQGASVAVELPPPRD
ncbi:MAG: hypothetical protein P4L64_06470 [Caulobacteraceae bacterium]|nr:hypothetical protein [Caulobacteraceae bacterium]